MIKSAVTISLVKEAEGGPFVFWHDLAAGCVKAADLGYDAVEVFAPNADAIPVDELKALTAEHNLKVAAVGTGGGWVIHKWHLCQPDAASRENAKNFLRENKELADEIEAAIRQNAGLVGDQMLDQSIAESPEAVVPESPDEPMMPGES